MSPRQGCVFWVGLFVAATSACGGADKGRTSESLKVEFADDSGSQPVLCSVTDGYEFSMIQDFETASVAGGWYLNNDLCDKCQKYVVDRIKELDKQSSASRVEWMEDDAHVDKWGCTDWRWFEQDAGALKTEYDKQIAKLAKMGEVGNPEMNIPANCREVCENSQTPSAFIKPVEAARLEFTQNGEEFYDQPRCGSRYAFHLRGGPFETWGGKLAIQLGQPGLDASEWEGISFWARVGPSSRHPLRVELSDKHTDDKQLMYQFEGDAYATPVTPDVLFQRVLKDAPVGSPDLVLEQVPPTKAEREAEGRLAKRTGGPGLFDGPDDNPQYWCKKKLFACNGDSTRESRDGCDKFGANRSMTGDWQFFAVDFTMVRQSGWGKAAKNELGEPVGLDKADIRTIDFMWTTGIWDVWLDDVALYRRK